MSEHSQEIFRIAAGVILGLFTGALMKTGVKYFFSDHGDERWGIYCIAAALILAAVIFFKAVS